MAATGALVTVTANPSIDRTLVLPGPLDRGGVHRVERTTSQAGGKGINISRAAVAAGVPTLAVLPAHDDDPFVEEVARAGIPCHPCRPAGSIRVNLTITEPDGTTTKLNSPGALSDDAHMAELADAVVREARDASWVVLAGSLPPGAADSFYADLLPRLHGLAPVAVDTSDAPLTALVAGLDHCAPQLMKPNAEELASITGGDAEALEADPALVARHAAELVDRGVAHVLVTLGAAGAVLVDRTGAWHASPAPTTVLSTVGAGDSSLFGFLLGEIRGAHRADRLALAVAYGSAAAALPGTGIPTPADVDASRVEVRALSTT